MKQVIIILICLLSSGVIIAQNKVLQVSNEKNQKSVIVENDEKVRVKTADRRIRKGKMTY